MNRPIALLALLALTGCPDDVEYTQLVLSMSSWAGECAGGPCSQDLDFDADGTMTLTGADWDGTGYIANAGSMTEDGTERLHELEDDLRDVTLEDTYGCPDCDDGGGMTIVLDTEAGEASTDYPTGEAPTELADIDAWFRDVVIALTTCVASPNVEPDTECVPFTW